MTRKQPAKRRAVAKPAKRATSARGAKATVPVPHVASNGAGSGEAILLDVRDGIAVITLNRPEKLNAFGGGMRERMVEALDRVAADRSVRVLVITGAGRGFCSGGDVQHMVDLKARGAGYEGLAPLVDAGRDIVTRIVAFTFPVIAAVNGVAAGAGCNLALACDVRLASTEARFGETFVRIGLHPDWGGTYHLPRLVGTAAALDLCWSGDVIGVDEAQRLGLVQRVFPAAEFGARWREYAARLAASPATSLAAIKRTLRASGARTLAQCLDAEAAAQAACWESPDSAEGVRAFAEKRAPSFTADPVEEELVAPSPAARQFE